MINFSPNLSDDKFMRYLKDEGLSSKDCEIMKGEKPILLYLSYYNYLKIGRLENGFGAMTFATDFGEEDIASAELGFSYGGKKVLRRLIKVCAQDRVITG